MILLLYIERKKKKKVVTVNIHLQTWTLFCFFTDDKPHKARELDMIILGNHAPRAVIHDMITSDLECPWHDYCIICRYDVKRADLENSLYAFGQPEKR